MKIAQIILLVLSLTSLLISQPLNGNYTVGGTSPDFVTLQDAANALKLNGVSGAVFFNIRPGTYSKNGGNNTVLTLDSIVTGLSEANRVTFQPDDAAGGNVDNVILEMNITNLSTSDIRLVLVNLDYVTFHNITFQEADSSQPSPNIRLVELRTSFYNSLLVEDVEFIGCKFSGSNPSGTGVGIALFSAAMDITIRENTFIRFLTAVSGTGISIENIIIENNQFLAGWRSGTGAGEDRKSVV